MAALTLGTGAFLWLNAGAETAAAAGRGAGDGGLATGRRGCHLRAGGVLRERRQRAGMLGDMGLAPAGSSSAAPPDWAGPHPIVVPAPSGLGTPRWHGEDRITVLDASSATTRGDLAAAWLAAVAHQIADALEARGRHRGDPGRRRAGGARRAASGRGRPVRAVARGGGRPRGDRPRDRRTRRAVSGSPAGARGPPPSPGGSSPASTTAARSRERARWAAALDVHVQAPGRGVSEGALNPAARAAAVERLARERLDVLVVGGGITGAGIALDAATRGLSVRAGRGRRPGAGHLQPVEQADPRRPALPGDAGLRLVREALRERRLLLTRLAPHLVRPVEFMFPLRHRVWERPYLGAGLLLYDSMGGAAHLPGRATCRAAPRWRQRRRSGPTRWSAPCGSPTPRRTTPCTPPTRPDGRCQRRGDRHPPHAGQSG
jgi:hypothetical protein